MGSVYIPKLFMSHSYEYHSPDLAASQNTMIGNLCIYTVNEIVVCNTIRHVYDLKLIDKPNIIMPFNVIINDGFSTV